MDPFPKPECRSGGSGGDIFVAALSLPPRDREAFVSERGEHDPALVRSVLALLSQYERLGSFLNEPAIPQPNADSGIASLPGTTLLGRFRIGERLGKGGMGMVFRAEDLELGETIALKMVREIWLDDKAVLARFREEIRLARKIAHPNVCRIYELFTYAAQGRERAFFTMEYVDGQSLALALKSGWRPEVEEILQIAQGISAGLDAAHAAGIVHCDLKPGNIMLRPFETGWRTVVMDFGLALALAPEGSAVTQTGQIAGSPEYMAPEQFLAENCSPAADVFALAVVIYEMATGSRPWPDEGLIQMALKRVGSAPTLQFGESAAKDWTPVLAKALARYPAERFQRAGDLVRALETLPGTAPALVAPERSASSFAFPSRRAFIFGGAASVLASFYAFYRLHQQGAPLKGDPLLLLTPMEQFAGYKDARALDFLMKTQLKQSAHLQILENSALENAWKRMHAGKPAALPARLSAQEARELAWFAGAGFVLYGGVSRVGDDYKLELKVEGLGNGPQNPAGSAHSFVAADEASLIRTTRAGANWVRTALGEVPADLASRAFPAEELTTGNWRALLEFLKAEEAWRQEIHGQRGDEAVRRLKTALQLDPGFALAAGRLGDLLVAQGLEDDGLGYQQVAISLMDQRDLTDRESLRIRGIYYQDTGQDDKAENLFSLWAIEYPKDGVPLFYKSKSLIRQGREEEGFALRQRAARLNPDSFALRLGAAQALLEAGKLDEAEKAAAQLPQEGLTDWLKCCVEFGRFQVAGIRANLAAMRARSDPFQISALALSACLYAELGQWREAEEEIQRAIQLALDRALAPLLYSNKLILAKLYLRQSKLNEARRQCEEILALKPGIRRSMEVGCLLAQAGALSQAAACMHKPPAASDASKAYLATPSFVHWRQRLAAELAIARHQKQAAATLLAGVPPPSLLDDWEEYKVDAFLAAKKYDAAKPLLAELFRNPGRYWRLADTTGPGFIRRAVERAKELDLFGDSYPDLINLQRMLGI